MADLANPNLISDVGVAAGLLEAAARGAALNEDWDTALDGKPLDGKPVLTPDRAWDILCFARRAAPGVRRRPAWYDTAELHLAHGHPLGGVPE